MLSPSAWAYIGEEITAEHDEFERNVDYLTLDHDAGELTLDHDARNNAHLSPRSGIENKNDEENIETPKDEMDVENESPTTPSTLTPTESSLVSDDKTVVVEDEESPPRVSINPASLPVTQPDNHSEEEKVTNPALNNIPFVHTVAPLLLEQLQSHPALFAQLANPEAAKQVWVNVEQQYAKQRATERVRPYQMTGQGMALGMESATAKGKVGASLTYNQGHFRLEKGEQVRWKTTQIFAYTNRSLHKAWLSGYVGAGYSQVLSQTKQNNQPAKSQFNATVLQGGLSLGYPLHFHALRLTPTLHANYAWMHINAQGNMPANQLQSLQASASLVADWTINERWQINGLAAVTGQTTSPRQTQQPQRTKVQLGLGVNYRLTSHTTLHLGYKTDLKQGYQQHQGNVSLQIQF